jgi:hypothetical protein
MTKKVEPVTVFDVAIRNGGFHRACKAVFFVMSWGMAADALGCEPTIEEYAEWWHRSYSTAYRQQVNFRLCLPNEKTPQAMWVLASKRYTAAQLQSRELGAVVIGSMVYS